MNDTARPGAMRILVVGVPPEHELRRLGSARAPDAHVIILDEDSRRVEIARRFAAEHANGTTTVIAGSPQRMLYKLSGPFEVIYCLASYRTLVEPHRRRWLAPEGVIVTGEGP